jgi:RNAse (barnase) inhibitor barstar
MTFTHKSTIMPNFILSNHNTLQKPSKQQQIALIDGTITLVLKDFYVQIAAELEFPDYFEHNLDSLDECMNDLEWLKATDIVIKIDNFDDFLSKERNTTKIVDLLNLLDATAEDWKWADEDGDLNKKNITIEINHCSKAVELLENEGINFSVQ